jgi:hypothetical protein
MTPRTAQQISEFSEIVKEVKGLSKSHRQDVCNAFGAKVVHAVRYFIE